jgi:uncharacterized membrane protein
MFGYVTGQNGKLIWLNLVFLFSIVLMPFSTAVYSEYSTPTPYSTYYTIPGLCIEYLPDRLSELYVVEIYRELFKWCYK